MGHLIIAQDAAEKWDLSEVIFIPAAIPPHKQDMLQVDAHHRLKMVQLAVESNPLFSVSDLELRRGGVSYSYDTLCELKEVQPTADFLMIVGSDTLVDLHNWYRIDELLDLCEISSFMRPGDHVLDEIRDEINLSDHHKERLLNRLFSPHLIDIASTDIRARVAAGVGVRYLVPPLVEAYIAEHSLYQG